MRQKDHYKESEEAAKHPTAIIVSDLLIVASAICLLDDVVSGPPMQISTTTNVTGNIFLIITHAPCLTCYFTRCVVVDQQVETNSFIAVHHQVLQHNIPSWGPTFTVWLLEGDLLDYNLVPLESLHLLQVTLSSIIYPMHH